MKGEEVLYQLYLELCLCRFPRKSSVGQIHIKQTDFRQTTVFCRLIAFHRNHRCSKVENLKLLASLREGEPTTTHTRVPAPWQDRSVADRKMIHLVVLAALIALGDSGCPSMCNCSESSVLCIQKDLESVPSFESLLNDPIIIDLSGNKINMIDGDDFTFDKSDRVKEIYLNSTELLDIDSEAFDELENLQELYLGDNLLNSLPETLIEDLPNMILLDISNNHFSGDMPKIRSKSLEVLAVANSKVTNIPVDSLKELPNLKMLLLQQNNINTIDPAVFDGINKNSFFVRLSYNAWDCSCDNIELFEFLAGRRFIDTSEPYQCIGEGGKYVDIYGKGVIQDLRALCENTVKTQIAKDLSTYKEDRYVMGTEQEMQEEELLKMQNPEKPYSLVKENNRTSAEDQLDGVFNADDDMLMVEYADDEESDEESDEEYDELVREIEYPGGNEVRITKYEEPVSPRFTFDVNVGAFVGVLCSFAIGVVFGFCVNHFVYSMKSRNLETSDSRTKLILP
ncbi:hypothetical protein NQ318_007155 [Aromia moschata]|uniref:Uncharacterized protein n=1 Tax=Aromia moschata TaxID=1265417 RepID=A0AAV8XPC4_9CUCU|nr:hypothetical protein NQ318_007155 [Aromia moschata]